MFLLTFLRLYVKITSTNSKNERKSPQRFSTIIIHYSLLTINLIYEGELVLQAEREF